MGVLKRYQAYVNAFEQSVADDDWSRIGPFFSKRCADPTFRSWCC